MFLLFRQCQWIGKDWRVSYFPSTAFVNNSLRYTVLHVCVGIRVGIEEAGIHMILSRYVPCLDRSNPSTWWRHQIETFSALLAICAENSPVPGEFTAQRPVTRSFDVSFDLRLNKRLSKQWWGWWFETLSHPLWRHPNDLVMFSGELWNWFGRMLYVHLATLVSMTKCSKKYFWYGPRHVGLQNIISRYQSFPWYLELYYEEDMVGPREIFFWRKRCLIYH